jgi:hypothetical protein
MIDVVDRRRSTSIEAGRSKWQMLAFALSSELRAGICCARRKSVRIARSRDALRTLMLHLSVNNIDAASCRRETLSEQS